MNAHGIAVCSCLNERVFIAKLKATYLGSIPISLRLMPFSVALVHHLLGSLRLELGYVFRPLYFKFSISAENLRCLLIWGNTIVHLSGELTTAYLRRDGNPIMLTEAYDKSYNLFKYAADCRNSKIDILTKIDYNNDGDNKTIYDSPLNKKNMSDITPTTIGETIADSVCKIYGN